MKLWSAMLAALILLLTFLIVYLFSPLLDGIVMGVALAYAAKPIKKKLSRIGKLPSSLLATLVIVIPVFVLIFYGLVIGTNQAIYLITHYEEFESSLLASLKDLGIEIDQQRLRGLTGTIVKYLESKLSSSAIEVTRTVAILILNFAVSVVVCFYVLADSESFIRRLIGVVPEESREEFGKFVEELDETFESLWFGNFLVAIMIGFASLPYFWFFQVPFVPLLAALMFLAALIPIFAEWMVILPVGIYLILRNVWTGVYFLIVGVVFFYILPELLLRPHFVGYRAKIHPLALMLAFIGGGLAAGILGFFLAPMLAALATAIFNYYSTSREASS
ncbi:MAG: AI-2E family transporter [Archaeoglobaceae archaeon]